MSDVSPASRVMVTSRVWCLASCTCRRRCDTFTCRTVRSMINGRSFLAEKDSRQVAIRFMEWMLHNATAEPSRLEG